MSTTADAVERLKGAGLTTEQAVAFLSVVEERGVTRDYLDGRLAALESKLEARIESLFNRLLLAALGIAGISIAITTALGRLLA